MNPAPIFASNFQTHKIGWLTDFEYYLKSAHLTIENISIWRISMYTYYSCLSMYPFTRPNKFWRFKKYCFQLTNLTCQDRFTQLDKTYGFCSTRCPCICCSKYYSACTISDEKKLLRPCFFFRTPVCEFAHQPIGFKIRVNSHTSENVLQFSHTIAKIAYHQIKPKFKIREK